MVLISSKVKYYYIYFRYNIGMEWDYGKDNHGGG